MEDEHQQALQAGFTLKVDRYNSPTNLYQCASCASLVVDFQAHKLWHYRIAENINARRS